MVDKQLFVFGLIIMFAMFLGSAITYEIMGQQIKIEKQNTNLEKLIKAQTSTAPPKNSKLLKTQTCPSV